METNVHFVLSIMSQKLLFIKISFQLYTVRSYSNKDTQTQYFAEIAHLFEYLVVQLDASRIVSGGRSLIPVLNSKFSIEEINYINI